MMCKKTFLVCAMVFLATSSVRAEKSLPAESDQQISDFSLAGYAEKGKKSWDISGKSADIFTDVVKLKEIVGNMYGERENIKLVADTGDYNKAEGKVHLEQNVVITTTSGAKMTTDSLDWDRNKNLVMTKDQVNIERDSMITIAQGVKGEPGLNKVTLEKDVKVNFDPNEGQVAASASKDRIEITCDGPLEIDYEKNVAVFYNNVKVENKGSQIYSDEMDVYFNKQESAGKPENKEGGLMSSKIDKIVAKKNVKIVRGENVSYSDEATYTAATKKITLTGKPRLVIYSNEGINASP